MSGKINKYHNYFFLIGVLVLAFMVYKLGIQTIYENLRNTGWWFIPIFGIWIIVYFFNAWSLNIIITDGTPESKKVKIRQLMKLTISAYAINYMTPLSIGGEPYKALKLKDDLGTHKATSSVLLYVMMHYVSHFFFWLISIPVFIFIMPEVSGVIQIVLWAVFLSCVMLILWAYSVFTKGVIKNALSIATRFPFVGRKIRLYRDKNQHHLNEMDLLISDLYTNRKKDFFASLFVELISRYISCFEVYFMAIPLAFDLSFIQSYLIVSIATLIANIFFFAPMQMGTREGGFVLATTTLALPAGIGVYIGLCTRIRELFWIMIGVLLTKIKLPAKKFQQTLP
ncbi:MAG TPA: lysylphosphatidylglycerol synthase transmembrane domain-containing protein [Paludibacteraceae bacterium]|nr:lysylphosphatidylglycerol synthase transmembrane domain-containing protein [Paludibacteraceae bacterium]